MVGHRPWCAFHGFCWQRVAKLIQALVFQPGRLMGNVFVTKPNRQDDRAAAALGVTAMRVVVVAWILLTAAVLAALFFAPRKPPAPPTSAIRYDPRPLRQGAVPEIPESDSGDVSPVQRADEAEGACLVFGMVTDDETGEPVAGARVVCRPGMRAEAQAAFRPQPEAAENVGGAKAPKLSPEEGAAQLAIHEARTDGEGRYEMRIPRASVCVVKASHEGFLPAAAESFALAPNQSELRVDFALSRGASVMGRVVEAGNRRGAPGIQVRASGAADGVARTGEDGAYILSGLVPGDYAVTLSLRNTPYLVTGAVPMQAVTISTPDERKSGVDFEVEAAGTIWGYVWGQDEQPVPRADVVLCGVESVVKQFISTVVRSAEPILGVSDDRGYYELVGVPLDEEWQVYAVADDWSPQLSDPFLVTGGHRTIRVDLFLSAGSCILGQVIDTAGAGIADAHVQILPGYQRFLQPVDRPLAFRDVESDDRGGFIIEHVPDGESQILAQRQGYKISLVGEPVYPDGQTDVRGVEIVLIPVETGAHDIYGTVTDPRGRPVADARLSLGGLGVETLAVEERSTTSGVNGSYAFLGIDAGYYVLTCAKEGYASKEVADVRLDEPTDITLVPSAEVRGRVLVRESGSSPEQYSVAAIRRVAARGGVAGFLEDIEGAEDRSFNEEDGSFSLTLSAGEYTLEARAPGLTPGRASVSVGMGETRTGVIVYLSRSGGRIEGWVTTADNRSPAGGMVWLAREGVPAPSIFGMDAAYAAQQTGLGSDGRFAFDHLPADTYRLYARVSGYAQGQSGPIVVAENRTVSGIEIVTGYGGGLQGYVFMDGELKSGVIVTVAGNGLSDMTSTDRNGFYTLESLAPGSYLASAVLLDTANLAGVFAPLHAQVEVYEDRVTEYNFGEETGAIIAGYVNPSPETGQFAFAVVRLPGAPEDLSGLNLHDPASWLVSDNDLGRYIVGMASVGRDGSFRVPNLPEGDFLLSVYEMSLGEVLSGTVRNVYDTPIRVTGTGQLDIDVSLGD